MDLKTYLVERDGRLFKEGVELQRIASTTGVTPYYLFMIAAGHKKAGALLARGIADATGLAVTPCEIRSDIFGPSPTKQEAA